MADINITDSYHLRELFEDIKRNVIPEETEETLETGIYAIISTACSHMTAITAQVAADKANEVFMNRARLESSIITHSATNGIDIMATPAKIDILLCLVEDELNVLFEKNQNDTDPVIIDTAVPFMIGEYEYHLDYPLLIYKKILSTGTVYTAQYDIDNGHINPVSDITNPYLAAPYKVRNSGFNYIFFTCSLSQVSIEEKYQKLNSNNAVTNKTYIVSFENQLAGFEVDIQDGDDRYILTPICEGTSVDDQSTPYYCWYNYIDSKTIRIKFEENSYAPGINSEITIRLYTTLGDECNFVYNTDILTTIEDTVKYKYNSMSALMVPQTDSKYGKDRMTTKELRAILPKQALSRGNITKISDIKNYFDRLNTASIKVKTQKKVDNQSIRMHYLYLLMKDKKDAVVPMNTLPVYLKESDFDQVIELNGDKQYILKQGKVLGYNRGSQYTEIISTNDIANYDFTYTIPFKAVINGGGPSISYYVTSMNESYPLEYNYINSDSPLQFIIANAVWERGYSGGNYTLTMRAKQNVDIDYGITKDSIMAIAVLYDDEDRPSRYFKSTCINASPSDGRYYDLQIVFETNDIIDENNNLRIENGYAVGQDTVQYGYFPENTKVKLFLVCDIINPELSNPANSMLPQSYGGVTESGLYELVGTISSTQTCTNVYNPKNGIDFYLNFSEIMSTVVNSTSHTDPDTDIVTHNFTLDLVPLVGYQYGTNQELLLEFINQLKLEKEYVDNVLDVLEGGMSLDFKFFNTYGPSRMYFLDKECENPLDRVNLTFGFNVCLRKISDTYTPEYIKKYVKDDIDNLNKEGDYHLPVLVSELNSEYTNSIYYTEADNLNAYGNEYMHLYYKPADDIKVGDVPEFICINRLDDGTPDITINIVE